MTLNCKVGDLVVVVSDEPGCEDNIGRFVTVLAPGTVQGTEGPWWSIRPVDGQPWACIEPIHGGQWVLVYRCSERVVIEDRCLRPVRGPRLSAPEQRDTAPAGSLPKLPSKH